MCCVKKRRARSHGAVSAMLARLYVFNKESTMTIDRQSIVYFINEKGGLALAAEVIHLTYMYT